MWQETKPVSSKHHPCLVLKLHLSITATGKVVGLLIDDGRKAFLGEMPGDFGRSLQAQLRGGLQPGRHGPGDLSVELLPRGHAERLRGRRRHGDGRRRAVLPVPTGHLLGITEESWIHPMFLFPECSYLFPWHLVKCTFYPKYLDVVMLGFQSRLRNPFEKTSDVLARHLWGPALQIVHRIGNEALMIGISHARTCQAFLKHSL